MTRNGKFFMLYKRAGFRVLINARGDCIVRPNFVEQFVHRAPGGAWCGAVSVAPGVTKNVCRLYAPPEVGLVARHGAPHVPGTSCCRVPNILSYESRAVHNSSTGGSLASHFLTSYQKSLVAVLAAQFGRKSLVGGKQAVFMLTSTAGKASSCERGV